MEIENSECSSINMDAGLILIAALCGIGIGMLWDRAEPIIPIHDWIIIRLDRIYNWLATHKLPKYPVWLLKGAISCEPCSSPWLALASGLAFGLKWHALVAMPIAFAIYTITMPKKEFRESPPYQADK